MVRSTNHLTKKLQLRVYADLCQRRWPPLFSSLDKKREDKKVQRGPVMVSLLNKEGIFATSHWPTFVLQFSPQTLKLDNAYYTSIDTSSDSNEPFSIIFGIRYVSCHIQWILWRLVHLHHCDSLINWYLISDIQILGSDIKCMALDPEV